MSQNHVIAFLLLSSLIVFSGRGLSVLEMWFFSSFLWVWKHPWSKVNKYSTNVTFSLHVPFISFILLSFCVHYISLHYPSCSFLFVCSSCMVLPFCFHVLFTWYSCPFIFRRYVSNIKLFERWYLQTGRWVSAQRLTVSSYFVIFFWAGNALLVLQGASQAKVKGPRSLYCPIWFILIYTQLYRLCKQFSSISNRW